MLAVRQRSTAACDGQHEVGQRRSGEHLAFALGFIEGDVAFGILYGPSDRLFVQRRGECDCNDDAFEIPDYDRSEFRTPSHRLHGGWSWLFRGICTNGAGRFFGV